MKTKKLTQAGVLTAVTLVLGLTPLGIIPIPPANVTIMHLPVIIGTLTCGLGVGLVASIHGCVFIFFFFVCLGVVAFGFFFALLE